jgi:hypothetical protein
MEDHLGLALLAAGDVGGADPFERQPKPTPSSTTGGNFWVRAICV